MKKIVYWITLIAIVYGITFESNDTVYASQEHSKNLECTQAPDTNEQHDKFPNKGRHRQKPKKDVPTHHDSSDDCAYYNDFFTIFFQEWCKYMEELYKDYCEGSSDYPSCPGYFDWWKCDPYNDNNADTPGADTPGTSAPGKDAPETSSPGSDTPAPATNIPGTDIPDSDIPGNNTPDNEDTDNISPPGIDEKIPGVPNNDEGTSQENEPSSDSNQSADNNKPENNNDTVDDSSKDTSKNSNTKDKKENKKIKIKISVPVIIGIVIAVAVILFIIFGKKLYMPLIEKIKTRKSEE